MTNPEPSPTADDREHATERLTMDYPVELLRRPDVESEPPAE
jgi:hypothetical protein